MVALDYLRFQILINIPFPKGKISHNDLDGTTIKAAKIYKTGGLKIKDTLSKDSHFLLNPNGISYHSPGLRQRRYPGNDFRAWIFNPKGGCVILADTTPLG